jgi:hypothetical protein
MAERLAFQLCIWVFLGSVLGLILQVSHDFFQSLQANVKKTMHCSMKWTDERIKYQPKFIS